MIWKEHIVDVQSQGIDWGMVCQGASAIATMLAVMVALWHPWYANKKKLKVKFVENTIYIPSDGRGMMVRNQYSAINIANVGNRKVYIQRVGIQGLRGKEFHVQPSEPLGSTIRFPYELDVEQSLSFPLEKKVVFKNIYEELKRTKKISKNRRLTFFVLDSVGKKHFCKTEKPLKWYLKEYKITD